MMEMLKDERVVDHVERNEEREPRDRNELAKFKMMMEAFSGTRMGA